MENKKRTRKNVDKEFEKKAKARLKNRRPEYMKKRVYVPTLTAILLIMTGIYAAIHATFYQSTDDAFVEGRLVSIAPRVSAPVIKLLVDDNQDVKKGDLLVELDPNDFQVALDQAEAKLAEAKADLNMSQRRVDEGVSVVNRSFEDITSAESKLAFAKRDFNRYSELYKDGIVSKQDYEKSKTAYEVALANFNSAQESSMASQHALASGKAKEQASEAAIKRLEAEVEQAKLNPNAKLAEAMRKKTGEGFVVESATVQGSIGTIPAGAVVPVELTEYISSQTSEAGDLYLGRAAQNYVTKDKFILVKEGATLKGQLVDVRPGKWFVRNGVLILDNALITTENDQTVKFSGVADVKKHRNWFMKFVRFCFKGEKLEVQAEGFVNLKLLKPVVVDLTNGWIIEE